MAQQLRTLDYGPPAQCILFDAGAIGGAIQGELEEATDNWENDAPSLARDSSGALPLAALLTNRIAGVSRRSRRAPLRCRFHRTRFELLEKEHWGFRAVQQKPNGVL